MNNHRKGINNRFNLQICYDPKFRTFTNDRTCPSGRRTIMTFFDTDAGRTQIEMTDCSHNAIYRLVAIIFMEESIEF